MRHRPTIDYALALGIRDLAVVCARCGKHSSIPLSAIVQPGGTPLDMIPVLRSIACEECSGPCEVDIEAMGFRPE